MHYVYLTNSTVTDQAQVDPYTIFAANYAAEFVEAADEVTFGWTWNGETFSPPAPPTPEEIQAQNKSTASQLLTETDWTSIPAVADPLRSTPHLANQGEFDAYRSTVRDIAINPPTTPAVFPPVPQSVWSS